MLVPGFPATVLEDTWRARRSSGTAALLAIGTANPASCVRQDEFADWYFRVTKSQHLAVLKAKMKRICEKSGITKRYLHRIEAMINANPEILNRAVPSLGTRLRIAADAVHELAAAAAARAIAEWGRPATDITHLVVSTCAGTQSPGPDHRLAADLGLRPTVQRTMLPLHGCHAGCSALRVAKDLAENNPGVARVLVVCAELSLPAFRAPDGEAGLDELVAATLFTDGAGAAIVGTVAGPTTTMTGPASNGERPIFHMVSAAQTTLPGTEETVALQLGEGGLDYRMLSELPALARDNVERCVAEAVMPFGDCNIPRLHISKLYHEFGCIINSQ